MYIASLSKLWWFFVVVVDVVVVVFCINVHNLQHSLVLNCSRGTFPTLSFVSCTVKIQPSTAGSSKHSHISSPKRDSL